MLRATAVALALVAIAAPATAQQAAGQVSSTSLPLRQVTVELPTLDVAHVVLRSDPVPASVKGPFTTQRLRLGNVEVPLLSATKVVAVAGGTAVKLELQLRAVPELVLGLPLDRVAVAWEGVTEDGLERLAIDGTVNPTDPSSVTVPLSTLYANYSKIADVRMSTEGGQVLVRVLASLYNPFSFDLVANSVDYRVSAGEKQIIAGQQRGFRARGRRWSDLVIEQEVAPADAAVGGFAALLRPSSVQVEVTMSIRTPSGNRPISLTLGGVRSGIL